jgi:hypothetical protein
MNLAWVLLLAFIFVIGAAVCCVVGAAYWWGRFSSIQTIRNCSSRQKAYMAALLPSVVFAVCFRFNPDLAPHAVDAFLWLGVPAALGTTMRYRELQG